jgi:DNA-binding MarR family transcriptional regulator
MIVYTFLCGQPIAYRNLSYREKRLLTPIQQQVLEVIKNNPTATLDEIAAVMRVSRSSIANHTRRLREMGLLSRVGRKSDGKWVVMQK